MNPPLHLLDMLRWLLGEMRLSLDDMIEKRHPPRNLRRGDAE